MKLLLLADLHFRDDWYRWVAQQRADLTVIAGDMLDGFRAGGLPEQMVLFAEWCERFPRPLALCSGNHDGPASGISLNPLGLASLSPTRHSKLLGMLSHAESWMDALERPGLITDGRSLLLETSHGPWVVTTIPFHALSRGLRYEGKLWQQGAELRSTHSARWLVLHHEPPADTTVGGYAGDPSLFYQVRESRPDFLVSGHLHAQPYRGSFADQIEATWCFNPGMPPPEIANSTAVPNHIWLDMDNGTATWHATHPSGTPLVKQITLSGILPQPTILKPPGLILPP